MLVTGGVQVAMADQDDLLTADVAAQVMWPSPRQSLWFLVWYGLLVMPQCCGNGHEWTNFNRNKEGGNYFLHCTARVVVEGLPPPQDDEDDESAGSSSPKKKMCNKKLTWRRPGTLAHYCARTMGPDKYLRCLYWFSDDCPYRTARKHAKASPKVWGTFVHRVRSILWLVMSRGQDQLGGPGKIVAVDETWLTTKKRVRGGFRGRETAGTKTTVLGMAEIDLESRRCTGKCRLLQIPDRKASTLQRHVRAHVLPGSLVFTDAYVGYRWLGKRGSGYVHRCVNHKKKEFSRTEEIFGVNVVVSSNAAEGLFGRLKAWVRKKGVKKVGKNTYGHLLAEFLWWQHCTANKLDTFSDLLGHVKDWQDVHPNTVHERPSLKASLPTELREQFESLLRPHEENVMDPPSNPAAPPQLPVLQPLTDEAHPAVAPSQSSLPSSSANSERRSSQESFRDSDSEVEIVCVRPGKRSRTGILKVEPFVQNVLPKGPQIKQEQVVKREARNEQAEPCFKKFCPQGHTMQLKAPGVSTSTTYKNGKEEHWLHTDQITCDVCKAVVVGDAWRCDPCDWDACAACVGV